MADDARLSAMNPVRGWRRRAIQCLIVAVLATQIGFAVNGYRDPHKFFAFQPFNESSQWQADIVRVTWSGERLPVAEGWEYDWNELVGMAALQGPSRQRHASFGIGATLAFLDDALDWIARNTPEDHETRYLEATVTSYQNTRGPTVTVLRSVDRGVTE